MGAIPWWRKFATNNATCVTDQGSMHLACIVSLIKVSKAVIAFAYIFFFRRCIQQDVKTRQNSTGSKLGGTAVGCGLLLGLNALNFSTCWRGRQSAKVLSDPMTNIERNRILCFMHCKTNALTKHIMSVSREVFELIMETNPLISVWNIMLWFFQRCPHIWTARTIG